MKYTLLEKQKEFFNIPHNNSLDVVIYQGGYGSGKTWCGSLLGLMLARKYAGSRGLVCAKEYVLVRDTTLESYFSHLDAMGYVAGKHYTFNKIEKKMTLSNGSEILFKGVDNPEKIKSLNLHWAEIEEASQISDSAFKQLIGRLRNTNVKPSWGNFRYRLFGHTNPQAKGFDRIAGYDDIKQTLRKNFIIPVTHFDAYKKQTLPNVILLYGPKGCGKTLFANALIDETKSDVIKFELTLESDNDFENLQEAISQARNTYHNKGLYTIIHIDEIDGFLSDKTYKSEEIRNLIQSLSNNYCTIIATTNYPEKVNKNLVSSGQGVEKIYIGPPDKKNIQEVLKYYMKDFTDFKIDYQSLTNILQQKISGNFFSNDNIAESIIYALKELLSETDNKINQQFLEGIIEKIEPDILETSMKQYKGKDAL